MINKGIKYILSDYSSFIENLEIKYSGTLYDEERVFFKSKTFLIEDIKFRYDNNIVVCFENENGKKFKSFYQIDDVSFFKEISLFKQEEMEL